MKKENTQQERMTNEKCDRESTRKQGTILYRLLLIAALQVGEYPTAHTCC